MRRTVDSIFGTIYLFQKYRRWKKVISGFGNEHSELWQCFDQISISSTLMKKMLFQFWVKWQRDLFQYLLLALLQNGLFQKQEISYVEIRSTLLSIIRWRVEIDFFLKLPYFNTSLLRYWNYTSFDIVQGVSRAMLDYAWGVLKGPLSNGLKRNLRKYSALFYSIWKKSYLVDHLFSDYVSKQ